MALYDLLKTKHFCVLPFVHQAIDTQQNIVLCCNNGDNGHEKIAKSSDNLNYTWKSSQMNLIRQKMLNNEKISSCQSCYSAEDKKSISLRLQSNFFHKKNFLQNLENNIKEPELPYSYDLRNSNLCNLRCRMCSPDYSTALNAEITSIGEEIYEYYTPKKYQNIDFENIKANLKNNKNIKQVYLAGGEPSIDNNIVELIKCIKEINPDCKFQINTNLFELSSKFLDVIKNTGCEFIVSIDGLNKVNDYIRYPSTFDKIIQNCKKIVDNSYELCFNITVQALNLHCLVDLIIYLNKNFPNKIILLNQLYEPKYMGIEVIPYKLRETFNLDYNILSNKNDSKIIMNIKSLISQLKTVPYNIELHKKFINFNTLLDKNRGIDYKDYLINQEQLFNLNQI